MAMFRDLQAWATIRRAVLEDGVSKRQICRETGLHWDTIQRILTHETPPAYTRRPSSSRPVGHTSALASGIDPIEFIDRTLRQDRLRGWADRHTPKQLWTILRDHHGCDISLEAVRRHVDRRTGALEAVWVEVSELLREVLGADSKETLLSLLPIDPRRQPIGKLRLLRRLLRAKRDEGPAAPAEPAVRGAANSAWILRLLLGRESLAAVWAEVGDSPDLPMLYRAVRDGGTRRRTKALVVLARRKGISLRRIARALHLRGLMSVMLYWRTYRERGADYLLNFNPWKPRKTADEAIRNAVFEILHSPPSAHNINRTTWRMADLRMVLMERGVELHRNTIHKIIKAAGYRWKQAREVLTSRDPDYREKLQRMTAILSALKPTERFFSIDEFGPFAVKMRTGRVLARPGEVPSVPQFQKSKGCLILTAALELSTNQVTHFYSAKKNTGEMLRMLDRLLVEYADCDKLYLSWDAVSWHDSQALHDRVAEINGGTYRKGHHTPLVELVPLPSQAQFLNVIESVFSGMAKAIIHSSDYQSVDEAKAAIDRYFSERNEHFRQHPKRAGKKIWGRELVPSEFSEANNCKDPRWCRVK
jgi:transposase